MSEPTPLPLSAAKHWCEEVPENTRTLVCNCGERFGEDAGTMEDVVGEFVDHVVAAKLRELAAPIKARRHHHACGCVTYFDSAAWRSRTVQRCPDHAEIARKHGRD